MPQPVATVNYVLFGLAVPGLYCALLLIGRQLKRKHGVRLGWLYHLLAVALAVYVPAMLLHLPWWPFLRHLGAAVIVLSATFVIALIERYIFELYLHKQQGRLVPKFFSEVLRITVLLIAVFIVLEVAYDQTIKGLLIAPGIAAVVVGLAMQDLVGNIIAGIALQAGGSFQRGDWLVLEKLRAEVVEINWRSTQFRTEDDICIEIPNREIARQTIINLNRPQRAHAMRIPIGLDYNSPPSRTKDVLLHAVANARGVLPDPKPRVFLKNFADSAIEYEIMFYME
ncbi:MAG TPA: mechanosensitive ion channel domain-containing protein, partial [Verrucomicrobiae bacterium]|nr:mechanosensitive ion channel domain-containing protein [Verrucomicrobiae bacterium]